MAPPAQEKTDAGLTRRVKGAHGPGVHTAIKPIRPDAPRPAPSGSSASKPATVGRADQVASMLSSFTGAVQRGREDAELARTNQNGGTAGAAAPDVHEPHRPDGAADRAPADRVAEEERT